MYENFAFVIAFTAFGIAFVILNVSILSRFLRPTVKDPVKETIYECGEPAIGSSWIRFDIRFYVVAIVFLLFEVEVAFLFPWAVVFKDLKGAGPQVVGMPFVFVEAAIFLLILGVALIYVWAKGDLDWVKAMSSKPKPADPPSASANAGPSEEKPAEVVAPSE